MHGREHHVGLNWPFAARSYLVVPQYKPGYGKNMASNLIAYFVQKPFYDSYFDRHVYNTNIFGVQGSGNSSYKERFKSV